MTEGCCTCLIRACVSGVQAEPIPILQEAEQRTRDYTRVVCQGELLHERSVLIGPRPRSSMGATQPGCGLPCLTHPLHCTACRRHAPFT